MITRMLFLLVIAQTAMSQEPLLKVGQVFPNYILRPVINAPGDEVDLQKLQHKVYVLNFWGTWCTPCIPEMDHLAVLQKKYRQQVQVVAVSDDERRKLQQYLAKKPSSIWLASDTSYNLYRQFGLSYVGQSVLLDRNKRIVALVKTDSISGEVIEKLIAGKQLRSNAETKMAVAQNGNDPFGIDSTSVSGIAIRSYIPDMPGMSKRYLHTGFENRRLTYINVCPVVLFKDAFGITSESQVVYEADKKKLCDFSDKSTLVCFDLLVPVDKKDSLRHIFQKTVNELLPFKGRIENREQTVYVLKLDPAASRFHPSVAAESEYSYSGEGFNGKAVKMDVFAGYLANELELPVINETGLMNKYDIKTENLIRTKEEIMKAVLKMGLKVEEARRVLPVLIIY